MLVDIWKPGEEECESKGESREGGNAESGPETEEKIQCDRSHRADDVWLDTGLSV